MPPPSMATSLAHSPGQWLQASHGVTGGKWWKGPILAQSVGKSIHVALMRPCGQRRLLAVDLENRRRTRLAATPNDKKQDSVKSESLGAAGDENVDQSEQRKGLVEKVEAEMGRQFGGVLWFTVLLVCLAVFGGGYVYAIVKFANFDDIPILRGPAR